MEPNPIIWTILSVTAIILILLFWRTIKLLLKIGTITTIILIILKLTKVI